MSEKLPKDNNRNNPTPVPIHDSQVTGKVTGITVWVTGGVTENLRYSCESVVYYGLWSVLIEEWCPETESNRRHEDFQLTRQR